ncbi:hypothetical protein [Pontibacter sp. G13]|uniref:hypothetical protein n=1 Tax=Pontibacter sp. G13 TaxID=3074898 RepID=UPI00288A8203|nr:hypothetical protein [Pontibacter sp. G13]WNJ17146.1 hypothetical protein RJD25_20005 [Pontibacter sp. G13]
MNLSAAHLMTQSSKLHPAIQNQMSFSEEDIEAGNRNRLRQILAKTKDQNCPDNWEFQQFSVGGLSEVGFSEQNSKLLLVISSNGRGLFDCSKLERIDRDHHDDFDIDYANLLCSGIGELSNEKIRIAGLHGGGFPTVNSEGESLEIMALDWPKKDIIFQPKWTSVYTEGDTEKCSKIYTSDALRVYGFSKTGDYFVIGTSSDLLIFKKKGA